MKRARKTASVRGSEGSRFLQAKGDDFLHVLLELVQGSRLGMGSSESEYEYAATSGGKNQKYPWGNEDATGDRAVMSSNGTMPVCSKPAGNTAQGLCDMSGNVRAPPTPRESRR